MSELNPDALKAAVEEAIHELTQIADSSDYSMSDDTIEAIRGVRDDVLSSTLAALPKQEKCCERDTDSDGNCDRHPDGLPKQEPSGDADVSTIGKVSNQCTANVNTSD